MEILELDADDINSRLIKAWGHDTKYYYYPTQWGGKKIYFHANVSFTNDYMSGAIESMSLVRMMDDAYKLNGYLTYRTSKEARW
jgi:hypothetical protein